MHIMTAYYYYSAKILKDYIPTIPKLKLTNAKGYFGRITRNNGEFISISLSKYNLDCGYIDWWRDEDINDLVDTIAHEFAHMIYWEHGDDHSFLTDKFKKIILLSLKVDDLKSAI